MSYFQFSFMPDKSTSDVVLPMENVQNIISKLDSKKVDENKVIRICTQKLSNKSISFYINFKFCLMQGIFPSKWVKDNCTNTKEKKNGKHCVTNELVKQCVKNSHQRIIYNIKLWFCLEDNIIPPNLYPILIKHFFDTNYEVRWVFLEMSKSLDNVWHMWSILKLKCNEILGNLLSPLRDFFNQRNKSCS